MFRSHRKCRILRVFEDSFFFWCLQIMTDLPTVRGKEKKKKEKLICVYGDKMTNRVYSLLGCKMILKCALPLIIIISLPVIKSEPAWPRIINIKHIVCLFSRRRAPILLMEVPR